MSVTDLMAQLRPIGLDPATGGYRRFSWSETDLRLRRWFCAQAERRSLALDRDRNGNLWAVWGNPDADRVVAVGSHLDSVPDGGAFDGALGVAAAFAALDRLQAGGEAPTSAVAVVAFTEEEGARFGVACLGSRLLTGGIEPERARALTDPDGTSLAEAMRAAGEDPALLGPDPERLARIRNYVELHIEQGRGLADLGRSLAICSHIWPHGRWRIEFTGRADHAGTTRMEDRDDPMSRFASTATSVFALAERLGARATFGRLSLQPNSTNSIPSRIDAWLDARAPRVEDLDQLLTAVGDANVVRESFTARVDFASDLGDRVSSLLGDPPRLATAAGHDAGILSEAGVPSVMLFVRNPTGVSHSPLEAATDADCEAGVTALASVIAALAGSP